MSHQGNSSHVTRGRGKPDRTGIRLRRKDLLSGGQTHTYLFSYAMLICLRTRQGLTGKGKEAQELAFILQVLRVTLSYLHDSA